MKQICNTSRASLRKRIKKNREVKRIIKSRNNNESVVAHEDIDLDLQETEAEEIVNDMEIGKDGNIFDILSLYMS